MSPAIEMPTTFDAAGFVADLQAAGYGVVAYQPVPRGGDERARSPSYFIRPPEDGFGAEYAAVMARWTDAMDAYPEHVALVVDYVFKRSREAHLALAPGPVEDSS